MTSRRLTLVLLGGLLLASAGCGAKTIPPPPTPHPVRGKVLLASNQPLRGGVVTFRPVGDAADGRYQGWGFPKPDGSFEITAFSGSSGVAPGKYKVTVGPRDEGEPRGSNAGSVPKKYWAPETTPWEVEVQPGDNDLPPYVLK